MRILTFTTLYPSAARPTFGLFVENRLRHLVASREVETRVVAPVPWFPFKGERFGVYGAYARTPAHEVRHGIEVEHPRFPVVPKLGMRLTPRSLAHFARPAIERLIRDGYDFDLIDAHYFFPDGVAAAMLSRMFNKPLVITARGTDLNVFPDYPAARRQIEWAADVADGLITVNRALAKKLQSLGAGPDKIRVLSNGVDLDLFRPLDRTEARGRIGAGDGPLLLSVGNLVQLKGHDITIRALSLLENASLMIAGSGPEEARLRELARDLGVADRVRFLGAVPQKDLPPYYAAADLLVLSSSREGMANVLLESLGCGTPVVASDIPGMGEVVGPPESGLLMKARTPEALAEAVQTLLANPPAREATRAYAEKFSWDATTKGQIDLFRDILTRA
jgi:glycosyltransferase involved in cell wall biosynthesis